MIKKCGILLLTLLSHLTIHAQTDQEKLERFGGQVFLPSLEVGYIHNTSPLISGGFITKTSIEYRIKNNNEVFFRLNYDTHNAEYDLKNLNNLTNVVKGNVTFSDVLLGTGYRFGNSRLRYFVLAQAGPKFYQFPEVLQAENTILIKQERTSIFSTRLTLGCEFYANEKSAFTFDIFQNQVWKSVNFWPETGNAFGATVGFIATLF